jgi:hypothetical protein
VANSSISLKNYERYFTESGHKMEWSDKDQDDILDLIPNRGLQTAVDANVNVMGLAVLSYGISAEVVGTASGLIPKGVAELFVRGNILRSILTEWRRPDSRPKIGFHRAENSFKYFDAISVGLGN